LIGTANFTGKLKTPQIQTQVEPKIAFARLSKEEFITDGDLSTSDHPCQGAPQTLEGQPLKAGVT
jgi:hypothetical protein